MKSAIIAVLAICSLTNTSAFASEKVIYGIDNRKDLFEVTNPMHLKLADSTVALVRRNDMTQNSSGMIRIFAGTLEQAMGVCKKERFSDQPSGGFCSGSLIGKGLILTAGHCITSMSDCQSTSFVFGYAVNKKGAYPSEVPSQDVVGCKNIVYRVQEGKGADFAIIELDREITQHEPLKLANRTTKNELKRGDKLLMIGHPSGIPTKIDDGASVRDPSPKGYLVANTDSYGGNSGSAVFNLATGEIEGVLVRGETDFVYQNGCYVSNVCDENGCRGEDITKISSVLPKMP
jgi:V8-like Glu-specific endopeptidase